MGVTLSAEQTLWGADARVVAGMDEVGRGAIAGPVSVGVVALTPCEGWPDGLADSKALTAWSRDRIASEIEDFALTWAIGSASSKEVDERGIVGALRLAGLRALETAALAVKIDALLLDGRHDWLAPPPATLLDQALEGAPAVTVPPVTTIVKGDAACVSIAAASVLAKVARDAVMVEADDRHPRYGWKANKGYGTPEHLLAISRFGLTPWHRSSWRLPRLGESPGNRESRD